MASERSTPMVSAEWLYRHLSDPNLRIVDVRWYLGKRGAGAEAYEKGHLPDAVHLDVERDLSGQRGPGRHPLPDAKDFAHTLAGIGVTPSSIVVAYDDMGGAIAARLWWLLRYFGHSGGRVLDGGIQAWTAKGYPLSADEPFVFMADEMVLQPGGAGTVDKAGLVEALNQGGPGQRRPVLLDARARERYEGITEPVDAKAGHIPGAISAPLTENLVSPAGPMLSVDELKARFEGMGVGAEDSIVCYCGSGVTACHNLLALACIGRQDALLYPGSWSDWCRDEALPIGVGREP